VNFALFGYNDKGFSFEVEQTCAKLNTTVRCGVKFDQLDAVETIGSFQRNKFVPDADIAGVGVSLCVFSSP